MARTLDPEAHAVRRETFVEAAQRLIQAKGYEQMSIQDVLDELDASRGAFYHYYDSKAALLEAVIQRMVDAATTAVAPVVDDPTLNAVEKFDALFQGMANWKTARADLILAVVPALLADENAIVREKFRRGLVARLAPLFARIIAQGQREGGFADGPPEEIGRVLVSFITSLNEVGTDLFFARQAGEVSFEEVKERLAAYQVAMDRILGLPAGTLKGTDPEIIREWFGQVARGKDVA